MYRNLGQKFKVIAKVTRWVLFGLMEAVGFAMLMSGFFGGSSFGSYAGSYYGSSSGSVGSVGYISISGFNSPLTGAIIMAAAPLLAWLISLGIYACGQMIENSDIRTEIAVRQMQAMSTAAAPAQTPTAYAQAPAYAPDPAAAAEYYGAQTGYTGTAYPAENASPYYSN